MRIPASDRTKLLKQALKAGLKLLTVDTETSHAIARIWRIGHDVSISHNQVKVPNKIITIQYKWSHEKKSKYLEWDRISDKFDDSRNFDDSSMIEEFLTTILPKADIVLTQNGDAFDFKVLNERAKELQLSTLTSKPSLDILKLSHKSFKAMSHKLDYRSSQMGFGGKIKMVDDDWVDIEERGVSVSKKMVPYGLKDVADTERLMWKELPYYKDLPVAVERAIMNYLGLDRDARILPKPQLKGKPFCKYCRSKRHSSYDVVKKGQLYNCLNCKGFFKWRDK